MTDEQAEHVRRLEAVVAAAREVFSEFENGDTSVKQMLRLNDLRRALAALDRVKRFTDDERPKGKCYDCGLIYSSPEWIDALVPDDVWEQINPTYCEGAGLLCITCMARRVHEIGLKDVPVMLCSGVFIAKDCP